MRKTILIFCSLLISLPNILQAEDSLKILNTHIQQNKGKVIYIDFWASWCTPCKQSFPWMNTMQTSHQNLEIISINVDSEKSYAAEFLDSTPANFTVIYDLNGKVAKEYKLKGMPSSYIINKKGELVSAHIGFNETKQITYEAELVNLLNE